ncbi:DUF3999 family protein [Pseudomonas akapageensis]|uniref:DUF3999 family protein n=1 Tax=Pseudomonas akapageensis TaxID=2609961 RepID=UPI003CCE1C82
MFVWGVLLGFSTVLTVVAQDHPGDFARQVPLSLSGEGPWYRIELPAALQLSAVQPNLVDLRVFNAEGEIQPYAMLESEGEQGSGGHALIFLAHGAAPFLLAVGNPTVGPGSLPLLALLPEASPQLLASLAVARTQF